MLRPLGWLVWALVGCDPEDVNLDPSEEQVETEEPDTEVPPGGGGDDTAAPPEDDSLPIFYPYGFFVETWLGYDPSTEQSATFTVGGMTRQAFMDVFVFSDEWDGTFEDVDHYCMVEMLVRDPVGRAQWVDGFPDLVFGISKPGDAVIEGNCDQRIEGLSGDADDRIGALHWGTSYAANMSEDVREALLNSGLEEGDLVQFIGGGMLGDAVDTIQDRALLPFGYVQGFEVDESFEVVENLSGDMRPLDAAQMVVDGQLQRGLYICDTLALQWEYLGLALGSP